MNRHTSMRRKRSSITSGTVGTEIDSCCKKQLVVQSYSGPHGELGASRNSPGAASQGEVEEEEERWRRRCRSASSRSAGGGVADSGTSPSRLPRPTPSPWKRRNRSSPRLTGRGAADAGGVPTETGGGRRGRRVRLVVGVAVPRGCSTVHEEAGFPGAGWLHARVPAPAAAAARRAASASTRRQAPRPRRGT